MSAPQSPGQLNLFDAEAVPPPAPERRSVPGQYRSPVSLKAVRLPWHLATWAVDEARAMGVPLGTFVALCISDRMENTVWVSNPHKGKGR